MRLTGVPLLFALGILALHACQGLRMPQSPMLGVLERKSGRIVYVGLDGNIYTMNQAGRDVTAITEDSALDDDSSEHISYHYPTWAPDGKQLAFVGYRNTPGKRPEASLYTARDDGSDMTKVFSDPDQDPFYLYWLPSSEQVSFLSSTAADNPLNLGIVPAEGGKPLEIGSGRPFYWAWAPNSETLVTHTGRASRDAPDSARLSMVSIGTGVVESRLGVQPSFFQSPVYSPDGKYFVAAIENGPGMSSLLLATSSGASERVLADFDGQAAFDWSPSGDHIAYVSGSTTPFGLVGALALIEMGDLANPKVYETGANEVMAFFWSPRGRKLAYFEPRLTNDPEGGRTLMLALSVLDVRSGESLLLGSFRPTEALLTQVIPYFDQYQRSATIWSPDGRYLVVNALRDDERPGIFVVDASSNLEPRLINHGQLPFWSWK